MRYRIFETDQFQEDLQQIAKSGEQKIIEKLREFVYPQLCEHPHYGPHIRKLKGFDQKTRRYRIGAWRFFYEIDEAAHIVYLIAASHRSTAY